MLALQASTLLAEVSSRSHNCRCCGRRARVRAASAGSLADGYHGAARTSIYDSESIIGWRETSSGRAAARM